VIFCVKELSYSSEHVVVNFFLLEVTSMESPTREIPIQPVLEPWRELGRLEGVCAVKGDLIPWVVQVEG
jgi:hypothetical protein